MDLLNCDNCGSDDFEEQDGFYYCTCCQARRTGFAKQVSNEEDWNFVSTKEIHVKKSRKETVKEKKERQRDYSKWSTLEAFNEIMFCFVKDFFQILKQNQLQISEELFRSIVMQLWFKYLRESELAFVGVENSVRLHPKTRFRDNFVLGSSKSSVGIEDASEEKDRAHIPYYSMLINSGDQRKREQNLRGYGLWYASVLNEKLVIPNKGYTKDEEANSIEYRDPRTYLKQFRSNKSKKGISQKSLNRLLFEESISSINESEDVDVDGGRTKLMKEIKQFVLNGGQHLMSQNNDVIGDGMNGNVETNDVEIEEDYQNNEDFNSVLQDRMSTKTKLLTEKLCPFEQFMDTNSPMHSPLSNDLLSRYKLLALLYITVRLFNYNIYLSDLIRWCREGSIHFMNTLPCLPKHWEIMWLDLATFKSNVCPCYSSLLKVLKNVTIHCKIGNEMFPKPDLFHLIGRYLKDLNLPQDLLDSIRERYGTFVEHHSRSFERDKDDDFECFPKFDVVAILVIILTLRDLFDLFGSSEQKYLLFGRRSQMNDNLFIWTDWIRYSKLRLNLIKIFYLNLYYSTPNENLSNIDEILSIDTQLNDHFRDKPEIVSKTHKQKGRLRQKRFELREEFENLFFTDQNFEWKSQIESSSDGTIPLATFYPLTTKTESIISKIGDSCPELVEKLSVNYCKLETTPYRCKHGFTFHRRSRLFHDHPKFLKKKNSTFFEQFASSSLLHLFEMASIITSAKLKDFMPLFVEAEQMAYADIVSR